MNNLWLVVQREYLTRVTKKSFILATLITPLAIALFTVVIGLIFSYQSDDVKKVAVVDEAGVIEAGTSLADEANILFTIEKRSLEELRSGFETSGYDGILQIPPIKNLYANSHTIFYYSPKNPSLDIESLIRERISSRIREFKIRELQLDKSQLEALNSRVSLDPEPVVPGQNDASKLSGAIAAIIGGAMGMIMYMSVFIYGMMVMRSVMEEKTSRIVEVMVSSVKPFHLMMGKIIGVGGVGLTQLAIWAILIPLIIGAANLIFGFDASASMQAPPNADFDQEEVENMALQAIAELRSQNWWAIIPMFLFYFLGGYFLYASLFAAVGSAMGEDMGEGQSLTIPITIPVVLAVYIMIVAVQAPNSSLAVWSSIFPLFSPIVMPARLAFDPPVWQILLSTVLLLVTSVFFVWLSARIYRVGILLYGKKVTLRELGRWMFYRD